MDDGAEFVVGGIGEGYGNGVGEADVIDQDPDVEVFDRGDEAGDVLG